MRTFSARTTVRRSAPTWHGPQYQLGRILTLTNPMEALSAYHDAANLYEQLLRENPDREDFEWGLSLAYNGIGNRQLSTSLAPRAYQMALKLRQKLAAAYPDNHKYQQAVASTTHNLAITHRKAKRFDEAEKLFRQAIKAIESLPAAGNSTARQVSLAKSYYTLAFVLQETQRAQEGERSMRQAQSILEKLVGQRAAGSGSQQDAGTGVLAAGQTVQSGVKDGAGGAGEVIQAGGASVLAAG